MLKRTSPIVFHAAAGALIGAFFLQSLLCSLIKSPSSDEPPHIAAGLAYVERHVFTPNTEHPPLLKEMAGVSLLLSGIRLPATAGAMLQEKPGRDLEWGVGNDLISLDHPARVMFHARLPLILISTLCGLIIYLWGRRLAGDAAGLGALLLFAFNPTMIAHSQFVTTDTGMATFTALFFFLLWLWVKRPTAIRLLFTGLAMGAMLCAKFDGVFLMPVAFVIVMAAALLQPVDGRNAMQRRVLKAAGQFVLMCAAAAVVIMLVYQSPAGLSRYWFGVHRVNANSNPAYMAYMAGEMRHRFLSYFAVAWLLKEPIATIAAIVIGIIVIQRGRLTRVDHIFLFLPPLVLFVAVSLLASNIGERYLIPAFPFLFVAGGIGVAWLFEKPLKWTKGAGMLLCAWAVAASAGIYPDHLSYFNEAACLLHDPGKIGFDGGARCGPWWLDDSNTDWGQGLEQVRRWRVAHPDTRPIRLAYFGNFPPAMYGIVEEPFPETDIPEPGLYVVSVKFVNRVHMAWLKTEKPVDVIGHAFYVYDIRSKS